MRIFHLKMDIDYGNVHDICHLHTHVYNEGGEARETTNSLHRLAIMKHLVDATRVCKESALVWILRRLRSIASV